LSESGFKLKAASLIQRIFEEMNPTFHSKADSLSVSPSLRLSVGLGTGSGFTSSRCLPSSLGL
jgi:hypothetical protein